MEKQCIVFWLIFCWCLSYLLSIWCSNNLSYITGLIQEVPLHTTMTESAHFSVICLLQACNGPSLGVTLAILKNKKKSQCSSCFHKCLSFWSDIEICINNYTNLKQNWSHKFKHAQLTVHPPGHCKLAGKCVSLQKRHCMSILQ